MTFSTTDPGPYRLDDPSAIPSPALLVFPEHLRENLRRMIARVGDPDRLRPHVKTHKMPAIVALATSLGINKHKCATIAEAEMIARAGGPDALLAYQAVGPNAARLARLMAAYPSTTFRAVVDDPEAARGLSDAVSGAGRALPVLLDLEVGMGRTGIAPEGDGAVELYQWVDRLPGLVVDGLHAYDGHNHQVDEDERRAASREVVGRTVDLRDRLLAKGLPVPRVVIGGTPTFPMYAKVSEPNFECSPGTCVLQDVGYGSKYDDLDYTPAAILMGRVISRPRPGRLCLDLGHKAVAADPKGDRLSLLGMPGATLGPQSEEHLVVDVPDPERYPVGTAVMAIPMHICPTSALHREAFVIEGGAVVDRWRVEARDRVVTI